MRLYFFCFLSLFWFIPYNAHAGLKVLLCSYGISAKNAAGIATPLSPADDLQPQSTLIAFSYPSYIALYDPSGKVWEGKLTQPVKVKDILLQIEKIPVSPYIKSLIHYSESWEGKKKAYYELYQERYNSYKSLSHLEPKSISRCEPHHHQIFGVKQMKVEKKRYTVFAFCMNNTQATDLSLTLTNLFDEVIGTIPVQELSYGEGALLDLTQPAYQEKNIVLNLKNKAGKNDECDQKLIKMMDENELEAKNADVQKLQQELKDQSSPLYSFLLAMVLEDHQMYLDSTELYMNLYGSLSGKDASFNKQLRQYLLGNYLPYGSLD